MSLWQQYIKVFVDGVTWLADAFSFLGDHRWAAAIVALTLIVRTMLLPLAIKQIKSMREQQRLQPEVQRLRQKFAGDRQKMTEEMMGLYRREGVNPYAACLPMVAQLPVFVGIYQALTKITHPTADLVKELTPIAKRMGTTVVELAQQRGAVPRMPFLGLGDLAHAASSSVAGVSLIVLMTAAQLITTRQLNPGQTDQQRRLQMLLPLFFVFMFIRFPAGLVLYWATQSFYQLVQQLIMTRDMRTPGGGGLKEQLKALIPGRSARKPVKAKPARPAPALAAAPSGALGTVGAQRDLAEKRKRRRRKKKKRRR